MAELRAQKRGRRIAMSEAEVDAFLGEERTARVGTIDADGPHVTPLWFAWDGAALWLYSITRSRRWAGIQADPRVSVLVDAGVDYFELRGVEVLGTAEVVGEVPRVGDDIEDLRRPELLFARKYFGGGPMPYDERHAWLRVTPKKITSWDFRKLSS